LAVRIEKERAAYQIRTLKPDKGIMIPMKTSKTNSLLLAIIGITLMSLFTSSYAQSPEPFMAKDFEVPATLETDRFRLRMLTVNDVVKDFDAVTTSAQHLNDIWGPGWPDGLTLEQNLIDLGWHQKEFQRRRSFAYTVVALDESRVLGCVYINPTRKAGFDAVVYLWARQSELASGMETELTAEVKIWLTTSWPFKKAALPGINISNDEWEKLEELR
jgi:hypothetical protein